LRNDQNDESGLGTGLRIDFDRRLTLEFDESKDTSNASPIAFGDVDDARRRIGLARQVHRDTRTSKNRHDSGAGRPDSLDPATD